MFFESVNHDASHYKMSLIISSVISGFCAIFLVFSTAVLAREDRQSGQPIVLPPVVVEGVQGVVTEGTGSYTTKRATVGYKQPVDIDTVPQTVTVITRQQLEDANATSLEEAGYLIPNVTTATGNGFDGSLYSRGHEVFTYNVDGAPRPFLSLYGTAPDLAFFDRIEFLSGPSGVFQGSGEPVGTINLVRKRPDGRNTISVSGTAGNYDFYRGDVDMSGSAHDERVRARFISYGLSRESFMKFAEQKRGGGYMTMEFDVTESTTFSFGGILEQQDTTSMSGLPTFTDGSLVAFSRNTYIGAPWNRRDIKSNELFIEAEHQFGNGGVLKLAGRSYNRDSDLKSALAQTAVNPQTGTFNMFTFARLYEEATSYLDTNYSVPFNFFGRESLMAVGVDYRYSHSGFRQNFDFALGQQNIRNFNPRTLIEPRVTFPGVGPGFRLNTKTTNNEIGGYGYTRLQVFDGFNLTLGGRYASYKSKSKDTGRGRVTGKRKQRRFIPLAGASYAVTPQVTGYVSYSEIFQPQAETQANGAQLDPVVGRQAEAGTKLSLFDDALRGHAAVFWLEDQNRAQADPNNVGSFRASGQAITRGFETQIAGRPIESIDLFAGYSYVNTDLRNDPSPPHNVNIFGKYTFPEGPLDGFFLGSGMRAVSAFSNVAANNIKVKAPGYAIFNLSAGYELNDHVSAVLSIRNLLDKKYIDRVNTTTRGTFYGEPLMAWMNLKVSY